MDGSLEVVILPVRDVDASKRFYASQLGFAVDLDMGEGENRFVQLTAAGSGCSVQLKPGDDTGGRPALVFVVADVDVARAELAGAGVAVSPVQHFEGADRVDGRGGPWNSFVFFDDPDGYSWTIQERPAD
ncbi:VOC family protein [Cryptosporangium phraense]|uniref:VOC family protein n=1 Tax=Cryptosporangium phraense TaxID=2593070 RepID=A0A545AWX6_9ACTN|nr:VOC family protein [Cryptosporangium phraense]TQS45832.1 VOC family protein [Cryptosporangium phraense]